MKIWHSLYRAFMAVFRRILFIWVRTETLQPQLDRLRELAGEKPVCYVLETPSLTDMAVLEREVAKAGLAPPLDGLGPPLDEWRAVVFLRHQRIGRKPHQSERLRRLVEAVQSGAADDVALVPVAIFWGRSPEKERSAFKLMFSEGWGLVGRIRRLFQVILYGRQTLVLFSEPVSMRVLAEPGADPELVTRKLARVLRVHFRRVRMATIGPDLSHRRMMVNEVVEAASVRRAIRREADANGISLAEAEQRARVYAMEIAANFSYPAIRFLERLLTRLWDQLYDGVEVNHIDGLKAVAEGNEIIYVPCHRSHIDYLLLSYVIYKNGMVCPHIAAGLNLNMPVVGPVLRRGGAFFLRRSFRDKPLYAAVFSKYVALNLARGVPIEYFIEGGRSRTGRLLDPKPGMLSMTVTGYLAQPTRPVVFVPVYFGYERLIEGRTYVSELEGRPKSKESLFGLARSLKELKREFGKVHVNFGEPIALDPVLDAHRPDWRQEPFEPEVRPRWVGPVVDDLGVQILTHINAAADVNPVNLLSTVLLSTPRAALVEAPLIDLLDLYSRILAEAAYGDRVTVTPLSGAEIVRYGERLGMLERKSHKLGDIIALKPEETVISGYYRNNVLHLLVLPSLVACCFLDRSSLTEDHVRRLVSMVYPYIRGELYLSWTYEELEGEVLDDVIGVLVRYGLLARGELGGQPGLRRPDETDPAAVQLSVLARACLPTLERYYMTIGLLMQHGSGTLTPATLEQLCLLMAQRMSHLHQFSAPEFFDKNLFRVFIARLREQGVIEKDDAGNLAFGETLQRAERDARLILNERLRHDILRVINLHRQPLAQA
jgi:glycerol-3-phosphate O-acyltransferase